MSEQSTTVPCEWMTEEWRELRQELHGLRKAQLLYFLVSIVAAGVLLAFGSAFVTPLRPGFFLSPLLILIPCWWMFFDKATTINRIVAYMRLVEEGRSGLGQAAPLPLHHHGWETSLKLWRKRAPVARPAVEALGHGLRDSVGAVAYMLRLRSSHRSWTASWLTFFALGATCIAVALLHLIQDFQWTQAIAVAVALLATLSVAGSTAETVANLTSGRSSLDECETRWREVLK